MPEQPQQENEKPKAQQASLSDFAWCAGGAIVGSYCAYRCLPSSQADVATTKLELYQAQQNLPENNYWADTTKYYAQGAHRNALVQPAKLQYAAMIKEQQANIKQYQSESSLNFSVAGCSFIAAIGVIGLVQHFAKNGLDAFRKTPRNHAAKNGPTITLS